MAPPIGTAGTHNGLRAHDQAQLNNLGHSLNPYDYSSVRAHNPQVLQSLSATSQQQVRPQLLFEQQIFISKQWMINK